MSTPTPAGPIVLQCTRFDDLVYSLAKTGAEFPHLSIKVKTPSSFPDYTQPSYSKADRVRDIPHFESRDYERGLFVREGHHIPTGDIVLRIPKSMLITLDIARSKCLAGQLMWEEEKKLEALLAEEDITEWDTDDEEDRDRGERGSSTSISDSSSDSTTGSFNKMSVMDYAKDGNRDVDDKEDNTEDEGDGDGDRVVVAGIDVSSIAHNYLACFILEDYKAGAENSPFRAYYDTLPSTLPHIPLFWCDECLHALIGGSYVYRQVLDQRETLTQDYLETCRVAPHFRELTSFSEYGWSRMIVASRAFGLQLYPNNRESIGCGRPRGVEYRNGDSNGGDSNGGGSSDSSRDGGGGGERYKDDDRERINTEPVLVPFADMINHHRPRQTMWNFEVDNLEDTTPPLTETILSSFCTNSHSSTASASGYFTLRAAQVGA